VLYHIFKKENPSYESSTLIKGEEGLNSGAIGNILEEHIENIHKHSIESKPIKGNHLKIAKKHFI
jgi:hypothetical protein